LGGGGEFVRESRQWNIGGDFVTAAGEAICVPRLPLSPGGGGGGGALLLERLAAKFAAAAAADDVASFLPARSTFRVFHGRWKRADERDAVGSV